jgi:flagellar motor switch protein FliG
VPRSREPRAPSRRWTLVACLAPLLAALLGLSADRKAALQRQVEDEIKGFLKEQLAPGEYFVYALVESSEVAETGEAGLPYTPLIVPKGTLQDLFEANLPPEVAASLKVEVTVGFDDRIPQDKRKVLEDVVRKRFGFDGEKRVLKVDALKLVSPKIAEADGFALERAKMESEQARLRMETERLKMEMEKKDLERARTATAIPQATATAVQQAPDAPNSAFAVPQQPQGPQLSPSVALFKDFQLTAMGLVIGIVLVVAIIVGGSFFIKGLAPLSSAIETVGLSIETAAKTAGGGANTQISVEGGGKSHEGGEAGHEGGGGAHGGVAVAQAELDPAEREFLDAVQDKIQILARDKNFSFFRTFSDMLESKTTLPLAAAVLVTLDPEVAREIITHLSMEDIAKVRAYLASEGALTKAKRLRTQALSDFYGKIALEEFLDSPLIKIKDLGWLSRMSTRQMAKFAASLAGEERAVFLACLSPERTKKLIESCESDAEKGALLDALTTIDQVTADKILPVIEKISARMSGKGAAPAVDKKFAVDGARYIAAVASDLPEAEQSKLFAAIGKNEQLTEGIREHFVPFALVATLPKELIVEMFSNRSDPQIAQLLFDSAEDLRKTVLASLPEIRAESVRDELKALDDAKFYEKRNRRMSQRLQKEISTYLQKLYAEGLIAFNKAPNEAQAESEQQPLTGNGIDVNAA